VLIQIDDIQLLALSIIVLFAGMFLTRGVGFLRDNYIPPAVTGGLLFSCSTWAAYSWFDVQFEFDMRIRDLLLLMFFSTVGLSAKVGNLISGGKALSMMVVLAGVFLVLQNTIGVGIAMAYDAQPGLGLMVGSISLAGGHGTAAAWGLEAEAAGLESAMELGLLFATFGLISGGLMGGPIARRLIEGNNLAPKEQVLEVEEPLKGAPLNRKLLIDDDPLFPVLRVLLVLSVCVSVGAGVNILLSGYGVLLPGFLTAMFVAIALTNVLDSIRRPLDMHMVGLFGEVCLNVFLAMSMMSMHLWVLLVGFEKVAVILGLQIGLMYVYANYVVFRFTGRDYDAAVMTAGFTGLGLGATPIALANMDAVTHRYGNSVKAFIVIPIIGAFFIDILNAGVINFFLTLLEGFNPG